LCFDIAPRKPGVISADVRNLPLKNESINCTILDPPFMARTGPGATLKDRFGEFKGTINDLWDFYEEGMREIYRVLKPEGWLIFKYQNGVLAGVNNNTHVEICNRAKDIGFKWVDEFILLATHRMTHPKHKKQVHARKYHCFFTVFKKTNSVKPKK
jgi:tRNA G10  N-methylase Trm11